MLQFITNTEVKLPVVEQIEQALAGGCRWIQIRMKDAPDEEIAEVVRAVKPKCVETEAFLILDDRVDLAKDLDVGGVHLGKDDMPPSQARMKLGPAAVIGVTANTFDDIKAVSGLDIDYLGIGPFRDTATKKNLAPILGADGIRDICLAMRESGITIPAVAVGGIRIEDVENLMLTGISGIAVSGAIAGAGNPAAVTAEFIKRLGGI